MITETEMREFFQKVVDHVAGLSTQASKVDGLGLQVEELSQRVYTLEAQNAQLQRDLMASNDRAAALQRDCEVHQAAALTANDQVNVLRQTIVESDYRVAELNGTVTNLRADLAGTVTAKDEANNRANDLGILVADLRQRLQDVTAERDKALHEAAHYKAVNEQVSNTLRSIGAIVNPPATYLEEPRQDVA